MTDQTHTLDVPPGLPLPLVRDFLGGIDSHLPSSTREGLALVTTEVVSNAMRHGGQPIRLEIVPLAGTVRVVVRSQGGEFGWNGRPRMAGQVGGWGLVIVNRLADRWGIRRVDDSNEVWLEIDH
ncbi:MAG TPA: ATP-binding protein [Thermoleophilaceae bacterium]|nr:ATP-binding protein [Thermoleophilaceae bacterium]